MLRGTLRQATIVAMAALGLLICAWAAVISFSPNPLFHKCADRDVAILREADWPDAPPPDAIPKLLPLGVRCEYEQFDGRRLVTQPTWEATSCAIVGVGSMAGSLILGARGRRRDAAVARAEGRPSDPADADPPAGVDGPSTS